MTNKLILGTAQFGLNYGINNFNGRPNNLEIFKILNYAYNNEIRTLDTAEDYGIAHEVISQYLKKFPKNKFDIITKVNPQNVKKSFLLSKVMKICKFFNSKNLAGFMFHNLQKLKENESLYGEILKIKKNGFVKEIGISVYENFEIEDVVNNYSDFDFIQIPFNLLDNENLRKKYIDIAKNKNIKIHARSIFLQGLFFKKPSLLNKKFVNIIPELEYLNKISKKNSIKINEMALKYVVEKKYIDKVLIGVDNINQIIENIKICNNPKDSHSKLISKIFVDDNKILYPKNW